MGIIPSKTEVEFLKNEEGYWYLSKTESKPLSRFRTAHQLGNLTMSTDEIMALARSTSNED